MEKITDFLEKIKSDVYGKHHRVTKRVEKSPNFLEKVAKQVPKYLHQGSI
jgi:hypothetical protein